MSVPMNLQALRQEVLNHGFDQQAFAARINQYLNDALAKVARKVDYFTDQVEDDFQTVSGQVVYPWESPPVGRIQDVFDADLGDLLEYAETRAMDNSDPNLTGRPRWYTIMGSALRLYPIPDDAYNLTMRYWRLPPTLTSDTQNATIPADYADMLIFWAISRCYFADDDPQMGQVWEQKFNTRLSEFSADVKFPSSDSANQARGMWDQSPSLDSFGLSFPRG